MKTPEEILEILKSNFPDSAFSMIEDLPTEEIISVPPSDVKEISKFLRDSDGLEFDSLMVLSGVDDANGEKPAGDSEDDTIKGGTLSVYYHLHSTKVKHKITLKVSVPREVPEVESVESVWKTANWHEREAYDLVGIKFLNHPDLRRILMPYDWEEGSHPLRKDYENPEFYNGMKVPY